MQMLVYVAREAFANQMEAAVVTDGVGSICLPCARRKLAGKSKESCADCLLLNFDPRTKAYQKIASAIKSDADEADARLVSDFRRRGLEKEL